jgi:hypothetical protein
LRRVYLVATTPAVGFHYFGSPEHDDDNERIAHLFLYCCEAVRQWPEYRLDAIRAGRLVPDVCDDIEAHVIRVFQEFVDSTLAAIDADNMQLFAARDLLQRVVLANAYLALHAVPESVGAYLRASSEIGEFQGAMPELIDFQKALWEGGWSKPGGKLPVELTFDQADQHRLERAGDSVRNSRGRLERAVPLSDEIASHLEAKPQLLYSKAELAILRRKLMKLATSKGLPKQTARFIVALALEGTNRRDDPSATKAIDRKFAALFPDIVALLDEMRRIF